MNHRLNAAMRRLASESAQPEPPVEIEAALLAEFDRTHRRKRVLSWTITAGAIAASVVLVWSVQSGPDSKATAPAVAVSSPPVSEDAWASDRPFVAIPYVTPLAPYERTQVVRMEVPVAALIAAGLPMSTADVGAHAEADVVVGQDGRARAVRLVSVSSSE